MQTFTLLPTSTLPASPCLPQGSPWRNPAGFPDGEPEQKQQHCLRTFRGNGGERGCYSVFSAAGWPGTSSCPWGAVALLLQKPSPILNQPAPWLKQALWDACLGTSQGPGPTRRTHNHSCLGVSGQVPCLLVCGTACPAGCVRLRRGAHICAVSLGF